jgi:hypothetical protein
VGERAKAVGAVVGCRAHLYFCLLIETDMGWINASELDWIGHEETPLNHRCLIQLNGHERFAVRLLA